MVHTYIGAIDKFSTIFVLKIETCDHETHKLHVFKSMTDFIIKNETELFFEYGEIIGICNRFTADTV